MDDIFEDKTNPFWYVNFELVVILDQLEYYFVDCIVHLYEFLELVWFLLEYFWTFDGFTIFYLLFTITVLSHEVK